MVPITGTAVYCAPEYSPNPRLDPFVSPVYSFTAMLIQLEKGYSDRVIEEASRFDDRVKYAMTAPRDYDGIDAMTLCDHRKRLFGSDIGREILAEWSTKAHRDIQQKSKKHKDLIRKYREE